MVFDYDVFLSFSSADEALVRPIWQELCLSGMRVFWSDTTLRDSVGASWFDIIQTSLDRSRHLLLVCTPSSLRSEWVKREYVAFYNHCYRPNVRRLVPLLVADLTTNDLPLFLREIEACRLGEPQMIKRLVQVLGGTDFDALQKELEARDEEVRALRETVRSLQSALELAIGQPVPPHTDHPRGEDGAPRALGTSETAAAAIHKSVAPVTQSMALSSVDPVPSVSDLVTCIEEALHDIEAKEDASMGSFYMNDTNSRRTFGRLKNRLASVPSDDIRQAIIPFLESTDAMVRWKAMRLLVWWKLPTPQIVRRFWEREPKWLPRQIAIEAAQGLAVAERLDLLADIALLDDNPRNRAAALPYLAGLAQGSHRRRVVNVLLEVLDEVEDRAGAWGARPEALKQLRILKVDEAVDRARQILRESQENSILIEAARLIAEQGPIDTLSDIGEAFEKERLNDHAFKGFVSTFLRRFGAASVSGMISAMESPKARETGEAVVSAT